MLASAKNFAAAYAPSFTRAFAKEKTMRERLLAGEKHMSNTPDLIAERNRARHLCAMYNKTEPQEAEKRKLLLNEIFMDNVNAFIEPPFTVDYGKNIKLGNNVYMNFNCCFIDDMRVEIGDDVLFGPNVCVCTACHPTDPAERRTGIEFSKPIKIGNNCWIGANAVICPGVTIGDHSIVGAGCVVTKDVEPCTIVGGNPMRVIRKVTPPAENK